MVTEKLIGKSIAEIAKKFKVSNDEVRAAFNIYLKRRKKYERT